MVVFPCSKRTPAGLKPVNVYHRELRPGGYSHPISTDYDGHADLGRYRLHRLQRTN
jgi:hypothetical protein